MSESKTLTVARINQVDIVVIENGEKRVAIKPICEALGISIQGQLEKLKSDPILSSVIKMIFTTGSDGKEYEMQTIPFKYVFGWLFRIDSRNVKEEAREAVLKYQLQCYDALFDYFNGVRDFLEEKESQMDIAIERVKMAKRNFNTARNIKYTEENKLQALSKITYEQFKKSGFQLELDLELCETIEE